MPKMINVSKLHKREFGRNEESRFIHFFTALNNNNNKKAFSTNPTPQ